MEGTEVLIASEYKAHPNCQRDQPEKVAALLKWLKQNC
jgi:hypothetical protein